jgi:hypothetical protein
VVESPLVKPYFIHAADGKNYENKHASMQSIICVFFETEDRVRRDGGGKARSSGKRLGQLVPTTIQMKVGQHMGAAEKREFA